MWINPRLLLSAKQDVHSGQPKQRDAWGCQMPFIQWGNWNLFALFFEINAHNFWGANKILQAFFRSLWDYWQCRIYSVDGEKFSSNLNGFCVLKLFLEYTVEEKCNCVRWSIIW